MEQLAENTSTLLFSFKLYGYELVGPKTGVFTAMTLPWLELLVGLSLVGGIFIMGALLCSVAMAAAALGH